MSDGLDGKNTTPFIQFMLTVVPAGVVVIAGWLFGNIFAEQKHQRLRQEELVKKVTALHRDHEALKAQYEDTRLFYRDRLVNNETSIHDLEKKIQAVATEMRVYRQQKQIQAMKDISRPGSKIQGSQKLKR